MSHEYDDDAPRFDVQPHRGQTVLVLGILSLFFVQLILGPIAWVMGRNDLREMDRGRMDPTGRDSTNAGKICGMVATFLGAGGLAVSFLVIFFCMGMPVLMGLMGTAGSSGTKSAPAIRMDAGRTEQDPIATKMLQIENLDQHDVITCPKCNELVMYPEGYDNNLWFRCAKCRAVFKGPQDGAEK